jgi:hypothetical protein
MAPLTGNLGAACGEQRAPQRTRPMIEDESFLLKRGLVRAVDSVRRRRSRGSSNPWSRRASLRALQLEVQAVPLRLGAVSPEYEGKVARFTPSQGSIKIPLHFATSE